MTAATGNTGYHIVVISGLLIERNSREPQPAARDYLRRPQPGMHPVTGSPAGPEVVGRGGQAVGMFRGAVN
jgi:hypothetical protein